MTVKDLIIGLVIMGLAIGVSVYFGLSPKPAGPLFLGW